MPVEALSEKGYDLAMAELAARKGPIFYVVVNGKELDGQQFQVSSDGLLVGRSATCDIIFQNREVSRRHCYFYPNAGTCCVQDLGSRNGILVNAKPAKNKRLADGDVVDIGPSRLVLHVEGSPDEDEPEAAAGLRQGTPEAAESAFPRHPLAISGLVFALLAYLHWAFGLCAVILALVALWETRREAGRSERAFAVGAIVLGVVGGGMNMWFTERTPRLREKNELQSQVECRDNLTRIAVALNAYQAARDGAYPGRLHELVAEGRLRADRLVCPGSRLDGGTGQEYLFLGRHAGSGEGLPDVIACDASLACHQDSGGWALRSDGRVEWVPRERFAEVLSQLARPRQARSSSVQGSGGGQL